MQGAVRNILYLCQVSAQDDVIWLFYKNLEVRESDIV